MQATHKENLAAPDSEGHRYTLAYAAIAGLFAFWGLAQWDFSILLFRFAAYFGLTPGQSSLIGATFSVTYFALAIPASLVHRRLGFKLGVTFALAVSALGPFLIYPSITEHGYGYFLGAVAVMGVSWPLLETSLNPLAVAVGPRRTAVSRINLVQAFGSVGLAAGYFVGEWLIPANFEWSMKTLAASTALPFIAVGLAILVLAFLIDKVPFPADPVRGRLRDEIPALWRDRFFRFFVLAIFLFQLAQSVIWSTTVAYTMQELPGTTPGFGMKILVVCGLLYALGRFGGAALTPRIAPAKLLAVSLAIALVLMAPAAALGGTTGLGCLVAMSLFMAITYPTLFGLAVRDLGASAKLASGVLVTATGLGAFLAPIFLNMSQGPARLAILTAVPCLLAVLACAVYVSRTKP
jgi:MFS transporter, FHS family, L-fucose permease